METEKEIKLSFFGFEIICKKGNFTTKVYWKPTFRGIYGNFKSLLLSVCKFGMAYTIFYTYSFVFAQIRHNFI